MSGNKGCNGSAPPGRTSVAFLVTVPYQVFQYKWIAAHVPDATALIELRARDYGVSEAFVRTHMPGCRVEWVAHHRLPGLDGRFGAIVCHTPGPRLALMERTLVVAHQYSLAKERYQYGAWRSQADLNLMFGPYSWERVADFCHAVVVGNPLLDPCQRPPSPASAAGRRPRLLYLPTHSELSSLYTVLPRLRDVAADITLKLHYAEARAAAAVRRLARQRQLRVVYSDADPVALLREHDGVLSDVSGAIYEGLYAGLPVVLTPPLPRSFGHEHLAPQEWDHSGLAEVTATWWAGEDLLAAFAAAAARLESAAYQEFVAARFVNPGTAGVAGAREIGRLLAETGSCRVAARRPGTGAGAGRTAARQPGGRVWLAYRRLRWQLARIGPLRRAMRHLEPRWRAMRPRWRRR